MTDLVLRNLFHSKLGFLGPLAARCSSSSLHPIVRSSSALSVLTGSDPLLVLQRCMACPSQQGLPQTQRRLGFRRLQSSRRFVGMFTPATPKPMFDSLGPRRIRQKPCHHHSGCVAGLRPRAHDPHNNQEANKERETLRGTTLLGTMK